MAQTKRQIDQMVAFIEQEAKEKAAEIEAKTEQERDKQLSLMSLEGRQKINKEHDARLKDLDVKKRILKAKESQKQLARKMNSREDLLDSCLAEATEKLNDVSNGAGYKALVQKLIVQGLLKLLEDDVKIKCRKKDMALVRSVKDAAVQEYKDYMNSECRKNVTCSVRIDEKSFVSENSAGGVILLGHHNKIGCDNTLDTRLRLAYEDLKPVVRATLFPSMLE